MVTDLLQRVRLASPEGGLWEAADLQWAWRRDQHPDPSTATFWIEGSDAVAAALITNSGEELGLNLIVPFGTEQLIPKVFEAALETVARLPHLTTAIDVGTTMRSRSASSATQGTRRNRRSTFRVGSTQPTARRSPTSQSGIGCDHGPMQPISPTT